jgi:hypothetical protein
MQAFHNGLFSTPERQNAYLAGLARLSETELDAIIDVRGQIVWSIWEDEDKPTE